MNKNAPHARASSSMPITPPRMGRLFVFLGIAPCTGKTYAMLLSAQQAYQAGKSVYVMELNLGLAAYRQEISGLLVDMKQSEARVAEKHAFDEGDDAHLAAILDQKIDCLVMGEIAREEQSAEANARRLRFIEKALKAGTDVYVCANIYQVAGMASALMPPIDYPSHAVINRNFLMRADTIEMVDSVPLDVVREFREKKQKLPVFMREQLRTFYSGSVLQSLREQAFMFVNEHIETQRQNLENTRPSWGQRMKYFWNVELTWLEIAKDGLIAFLMICLATLLNFLVYRFTAISFHNVPLVYILALTYIAFTVHLYVTIISALVTFYLLHAFFLPHAVNESVALSNIMTLVIFALCAVGTGAIAAHYRKRGMFKSTFVPDRSRDVLLDFSMEVNSAETVYDVLQMLYKTLLKRDALIVYTALYDEKGGMALLYPDEKNVPDDVLQEMLAYFKRFHNNAEGEKLGEAHLFELRSNRRLLGIISVGNRQRLTPREKVFLRRMCLFSALAIERILLNYETEQALLDNDRESFRAALLSSVSHDLKTPLVSIIGSLSTVKSLGERLAKKDRDELIDVAVLEANRLNRFISNILEISRLEAGLIMPKRQWLNMRTLLSENINALRTPYPDIQLVLDMEDKGIEAYVDPVMFSQMVAQLVDNVNAHTPHGTTLTISGKKEKNGFSLRFSDDGPGFKEADLSHLFDKFHRAAKKDNLSARTGLGLAICRGIISAHDGTIHAQQHKDAGAVISISLRKEHIRNGNE